MLLQSWNSSATSPQSITLWSFRGLRNTTLQLKQGHFPSKRIVNNILEEKGILLEHYHAFTAIQIVWSEGNSTEKDSQLGNTCYAHYLSPTPKSLPFESLSIQRQNKLATQIVELQGQKKTSVFRFFVIQVNPSMSQCENAGPESQPESYNQLLIELGHNPRPQDTQPSILSITQCYGVNCDPQKYILVS